MTTSKEDKKLIKRTPNHLHKDHRSRMRERFLSSGLDSFCDHEVLEMLLYFSIPLRDTNPVAHRLINEFGSLGNVLEADAAQLMQVEGIGAQSATLIKMIAPICRRYLDSKNTVGVFIRSLEDAGEFVKSKFIGEKDEVIMAVALDSKNQVLMYEELARGSINAVAITSRKLGEFLIRSQGVSVILSHNHPNGVALPSRADLETTKNTILLLQSLGAKLLDHIIVAGDDYVSLAESGFLKKMDQELSQLLKSPNSK